jgi:hypothetical protein
VLTNFFRQKLNGSVKHHGVILLLIEFLCRVLQLMNLTDSRLAQGGCEKLELAMLSFFEQFRKIYVGDQVSPSITFSNYL